MIDEPRFNEALHRARARRRLPAPEGRRLLRERAGLSQQDIAAALSVTREAVALWEKGQRTPSPENLGPYLALLERLAREGLA